MANYFAASVYLLCFLTCAACAVMLVRSYRRTGLRLLMWSSLCFLFLAGNNFVVILDLLVLPNSDFRVIRHGFSLAAVSVLLFGFIWDRDG